MGRFLLQRICELKIFFFCNILTNNTCFKRECPDNDFDRRIHHYILFIKHNKINKLTMSQFSNVLLVIDKAHIQLVFIECVMQFTYTQIRV